LPEHYYALAHHYSRSGNTAKAVDYLHRAGQQAVERSAYAEAVSHLSTALSLLTALPETRQRNQQELGVQMTLGIALSATKGQATPEVERLYSRARELCEQVGEPLQRFRVLLGLWHAHGQRGEYQTRRALGEQLLNLALLAEASAQVGRTAEGRVALAKALATLDRSEVRLWEAELYRLRGELLLQPTVTQPDEAEVCFQQALAVARRQQTKSWELRAALSLSRLWQQQGKRAAALELLAPVYGWFTEGFDTADLRDARALLEELS
jgi:predicted ATPase